MGYRDYGWPQFWGQLALTALLTAGIKGGVALFSHSIAWWAAAAIAAVIVYGGFLFLGDADGWFD